VALACIASVLCMASIASAQPSVQAKTRVWAFERDAPLNIRLHASPTARTHPAFSPAQAQPALGSPHAARGAASAINITEKGLAHVMERHVVGGALATGNKSIFAAGENVAALIEKAASVTPTAQASGRLAYTLDAGRVIGIDRATGAGTSVYTVITEAGGNLVTAFPGVPFVP
jgi:hypothetical protein